MSNQRSFMQGLAEKLKISNPTGWYNITEKTVRQHGGVRLVNKYNKSLCNMLMAIYPEYLQLHVQSLHCVHMTGTFPSLTPDRNQYLQNIGII